LGVGSHLKPEGGVLAVLVFKVGFSPCVYPGAFDGSAISKGLLVILG
jgi:hypothetical protein